MSKQENEQKKGRKGGSKGVVIVGGIATVIIVVLVGVIVLLLKPQEEKRNVVVNKENVEKIVQEMEEEKLSTAPMYYEAKMNSTWYFANGTAASENAYVENVETNTNDVYFDVIRKDTSETIYESPVLPVGTYLENITLGTELEAGSYDCVLTYHLVDENQKSLSTVSFTLTIVVEN